MRFDAPLPDVHVVEFGDRGDGHPLGTYRQVARHVWHEDGLDGARDLFTFTEVRRAKSAITLYDRSRRVTLELDLQLGLVTYSESGGTARALYAITEVSARPNGRLTNLVTVGGGYYIQAGPAEWLECYPDGNVRARYPESRRDDWSIYLRDPARRANVQLDLHREEVRYRTDGGAENVLGRVVEATGGVTGRLVNRVEFGTSTRHWAGTFRQTGPATWVEDSRTAGPDRFEFHETARDDWSVYLLDRSRDVGLQLDLHTGIVYLTVGTGPRGEQYRIVGSDEVTTVGAADGRRVNWILTGSADGLPGVTFHQTGRRHWAAGDRVLEEVGRTRDVIHLRGARPGADPVEFDLVTGVCTGGRVLDTRSHLNGWLLRRVELGSDGTWTGRLRQVGWNSWVEDTPRAPAEFVYDETGRDDWTVTLRDTSRGVDIVVDLYSRTVSGREIASAAGGPEPWRHRQPITSRSVLTAAPEVDPVTKVVTERPVYRTSVSVPRAAVYADVWASEEVTLEIDGVAHVVDGVRPVRVRPSRLSRISIATAATSLSCPQIYLRTNLMTAAQRHVLMPDVETHKKVVALKPGDLFAARTALGVPHLDAEQADALQRSLVNVASSVQHTYNDTPHGVHHDRAVHPANMEHPHFRLDFTGGVSYTPLTAAQVRAHTANARRLELPVGQGLFDGIAEWFHKAEAIVVHTVTAVAHDIVETVEHVAKDVVETVDHVGEDLVHGDLLSAGKDLLQGGEHLGTDLVRGVAGVATDVVKGAGQLLVVTVAAGKEAVQWVIDHTGVLGEALGWLLHKAGVALGDAVGWLLDRVGWRTDVIATHDGLEDLLVSAFGGLKVFPARLRTEADGFFASLATTVEDGIDSALDRLGIDALAPQHGPVAGHSAAVETLEWLLGQVVGGPPALSFATAFASGGTGGTGEGPGGAVLALLEDALGDADDPAVAAFGDALRYLQLAVSGSEHTPEHLIGALLELVKGIALIGIRIVGAVADAVLDLVAAVVDGLAKVAQQPLDLPFLSDFYEGITGGKQLTVLSLTCLAVGAPMTMLYRSMFHARPFADGAPVELTQMDGLGRNTGVLYATGQIFASVTSTASDAYSYTSHESERQGGEDGDRELDTFGGGDGPPLAGAPAGDPAVTFLALNSLTGLLCMVGANPVSWAEKRRARQMLAGEEPTDDTAPLDLTRRDDPREAPSFWSWVIWTYQFPLWFIDVAVGIGMIAGKKARGETRGLAMAGGVYRVFVALGGAGTIVLMGVLAAADDGKARYLRTGTTNLSDEDQQYLAWAETPQARRLKALGNMIDGVPAVAQVLGIDQVVEATEGISLVGLLAVDALGHLGEGIVYAVRTGQDALY
ncbi:hypothetical protein GCM10009836_09740 [Pseudonocardia ailaonensis]|uniref:Uncharacterized protein n=1 Tax=Pseudonocardia ailaonensis TaxID=367279 RepID=A0ABN2MNW1_9PSEU